MGSPFTLSVGQRRLLSDVLHRIFGDGLTIDNVPSRQSSLTYGQSEDCSGSLESFTGATFTHAILSRHLKSCLGGFTGVYNRPKCMYK